MRVNQVDLNLLVALDALLTEQNVTRAAQRLYIGQPAMSASLARLRTLFDDPLLVRVGRTMRLTPLAEMLTEQVRDVLLAVDQILTTRATFDPSLERTFTLMASDYATLVLLRSVFEFLSAEAPKVRLMIAPMDPSFLDLLQRGEVDFLMLPRELDPGFVALPQSVLFEDDFVCVVWERHPDVGEQIDRDLFSRLPHLAFGGASMHSLPDSWLDELGVVRNVEATTQSFALAPLFIRGSRMVAVVHRRVAEIFEPIAQCRILPLPFDLPTIHETLFWHPRLDADPAHRWLREKIASIAATLN